MKLATGGPIIKCNKIIRASSGKGEEILIGRCDADINIKSLPFGKMVEVIRETLQANSH